MPCVSSLGFNPLKLSFTEFSYGYAFTESLVRSSETAPVGAPSFPNLVQEAKLGYDIKIDFPAVPLFFQFKLPESMKRATAFEIAGGGCPGLTIPFFRMGMMRKDLSRQHERLISLESRYPDCVYYAAPAIKTLRAFNQAYNSAKVAERSAFFSPKDIGPLPDTKQHSIAYAEDLSVAYFCSEPKSIRAIPFEKLSAFVRDKLSQKSAQTLEEATPALVEEILGIASAVMGENIQNIRQRINNRLQSADGTRARSTRRQRITTELQVIREVARVDLGVDFVIAQPR